MVHRVGWDDQSEENKIYLCNNIIFFSFLEENFMPYFVVIVGWPLYITSMQPNLAKSEVVQKSTMSTRAWFAKEYCLHLQNKCLLKVVDLMNMTTLILCFQWKLNLIHNYDNNPNMWNSKNIDWCNCLYLKKVVIWHKYIVHSFEINVY